MTTYLTTEQVANVLGVSTRTVTRMVAKGQLIVADTRRPRGYLFDPDFMRPDKTEPGPQRPP